jgi:hypothetical protein
LLPPPALGEGGHGGLARRGHPKTQGFHHRLLKLNVRLSEDGGGIVVTEP